MKKYKVKVVMKEEYEILVDAETGKEAQLRAIDLADSSPVVDKYIEDIYAEEVVE